tara:strand:- start:4199 stop:4621 length:423 start_codon:yes stop_codon:yes gene_type:complete
LAIANTNRTNDINAHQIILGENMTLFQNKTFQLTFQVLLLLFSLFVIYQILRILFGGSWASDQATFALMSIGAGILFAVGVTYAGMVVDLKYVKRDIRRNSKIIRENRKMILENRELIIENQKILENILLRLTNIEKKLS